MEALGYDLHGLSAEQIKLVESAPAPRSLGFLLFNRRPAP